MSQNYETVLDVTHFTNDLFWFKTTKSEAWNKRNFRAGEFTMIGMGDDDIQRAYSIATSPANDYLEFFSIKVQDGPLTSRLQHIKPGDDIEVSQRAIGTLLLRNLDPILPEDAETSNTKRRLWLISTGTGLAPFLSIARDPEAYEYYDEVIVTHTCRTNAEIVFRSELESYGCRVYQTVTREEPEAGRFSGRITDKIRSGELFSDLGIECTEFSKEFDRIMICGGPSFNTEIRDMLESTGWEHGTMKSPAHFVQERAFVDLAAAS
jgi:ferredoxin/flavodoxin---NADP+ reductase